MIMVYFSLGSSDIIAILGPIRSPRHATTARIPIIRTKKSGIKIIKKNKATGRPTITEPKQTKVLIEDPLLELKTHVPAQ